MPNLDSKIKTKKTGPEIALPSYFRYKISIIIKSQSGPPMKIDEKNDRRGRGGTLFLSGLPPIDTLQSSPTIEI